MKDMIRVIVKEPGKEAELTTIENTLEAMQHAVGGYIETFTIASDMVIICNEEGKLLDFPYNCMIAGEDDPWGRRGRREVRRCADRPA